MGKKQIFCHKSEHTRPHLFCPFSLRLSLCWKIIMQKKEIHKKDCITSPNYIPPISIDFGIIFNFAMPAHPPHRKMVNNQSYIKKCGLLISTTLVYSI